MASQEERRKVLEEKKAALQAAKKKKEQGEAAEDSVMQRAMALAQESAQNSANPGDESTASTADQSTAYASRVEVQTEVFAMPNIYSRLPKPKPVMKQAEVQVELGMSPGDGNVESDKNQPDNHVVTLGTAGSATLVDGATKEQLIQKISAASMIQKVTRSLTREEQQKLFETEKFDRFVRQAAKFIDHVLTKKVDILSMISHEDAKQPEKVEKTVRVVKSFAEQLVDEEATVVQTLPCLPKVEDCMVADLQWNDSIPDLLLVNYVKRNREDDKFSTYPGKVMLWSANNNTRPEFILSSKNRVTKARFDPYNPALVYGGCHNGEVLLWDARVSASPVTTIHPSNDSHFTPVYGLSLVGNRNSYNLITCSYEGKVCVWEPHNLTTPTLQVNITAPKSDTAGSRATVEQNVALMPMAMEVPPGHFSKIFLAGFEKTAYNVNLNQQQNNGNQIIQTFSDQGHSGPICGLSYLTNYSGKHSTNSGMLLTSSFDWTVKLWYPQLTEKCLATFTEHTSVVSDVCWNSMHPAKYASCSADGELFIWNLFRSTVLPVFRYSSHGTCLTKLDWNLDGRHLAVGDTEGRVNILKQKKVANLYDEEDEKRFKEKINAIATK